MPVSKSAPSNDAASFLNWQKHLQIPNEWKMIFEYPVYTDVHVLTNRSNADHIVTFGPYELIPTFASVGRAIGRLWPNLVLRVREYGWFKDVSSTSAVSTGANTGGEIADEIVALVALVTGAPCRSFGHNREWTRTGDPLGRPIERWHTYAHWPSPEAIGWPMLPRCAPMDLLRAEQQLRTFVNTKSGTTSALVRAAMSYSRGIQIAEYDSELAWLELVGAVETAADYECKELDPVDALNSFHSGRLSKKCSDAGGMGHVNEVAELLKGLTGATKKFSDFLCKYLPNPPSVRSDDRLEPWTESGLKKKFAKVYDYRSKRLHAGQPFPETMRRNTVGGGMTGDGFIIAREVPIKMSTPTENYAQDELPMTLNIFEHIVQGALLNWWNQSLLCREQGAE